jgi:AmpD protein
MKLTIEAGLLCEAIQHCSPNRGRRPDDSAVDLVVVHSISLPPGEYAGDAVARFFCNELRSDEHPYYQQIADLQVSAHLFIRRTGEVNQFVNFDERAWHAGRSSYEGREECNDYSIGIELEGTDEDAFEPQQYVALAAVIRALEAYYPRFTTYRIAGHSDVAPGRKTDPGKGFDWSRLRAQLSSSTTF